MSSFRRGWVVVLALPLVACSGSASSTPEGWVDVDLDGLRFAHPAAWSVSDEDPDTDLWELQILDGPRADASVELRATAWMGPDRFAAEGSSRLFVGFRLGTSSFDPGARTDVEVEGATSAERTRFTYRDEDGETVHGVWIVAADRDAPRSAALQLTALDEPDDAFVEQLEASMELTTMDEPPDGGDGSADA